jgi:hypothetical protein
MEGNAKNNALPPFGVRLATRFVLGLLLMGEGGEAAQKEEDTP